MLAIDITSYTVLVQLLGMVSPTAPSFPSSTTYHGTWQKFYLVDPLCIYVVGVPICYCKYCAGSLKGNQGSKLQGRSVDRHCIKASVPLTMEGPVPIFPC